MAAKAATAQPITLTVDFGISTALRRVMPLTSVVLAHA
jgi:hypothetical protein